MQETPLYVLISLHRGYGLGDAVQMSSVLRHVAKYRPRWIVDYQAEEGRHQVGRGIVAHTFAYGQQYQYPHYDAEVQLVLYDTWRGWTDRPNTRVTLCLDGLGIPWDAECGRYRVDVRDESVESARALICGYRAGRSRRDGTRYVGIHYEGDSSQAKKNLTHSQVDNVCRAVFQLGCEPVILDWRNRSPLPYRRLTTPSSWGGDAEMMCAVVSQCAAFVGIDSGPAKCASATDVPSLVVWTGHSPAPYHDPAANTTHLVPRGYHEMEPVCGDAGVVQFFNDHYCVRQYDRDPVGDMATWLVEVLG